MFVSISRYWLFAFVCLAFLLVLLWMLLSKRITLQNSLAFYLSLEPSAAVRSS